VVNGAELIGTTEHLTLYTRCRINRCRYNRVQLCVCVFVRILNIAVLSLKECKCIYLSSLHLIFKMSDSFIPVRVCGSKSLRNTDLEQRLKREPVQTQAPVL
jgi:hypothetical protein